MGDMFVHEIQLELSCSVLHLDNKFVRMLQILERFLDLVKPIYSFQLEGHRIVLARCATLHTSDTKVYFKLVKNQNNYRSEHNKQVMVCLIGRGTRFSYQPFTVWIFFHAHLVLICI